MENEEGGGNKSLHGSKPYAREKSFLRRVTEAVNTVLMPSFLQTSESFCGDEEEMPEDNEDRRTNFSRVSLNPYVLNSENIDLPPTSSHYVLHSSTSKERISFSGEPQISSTRVSEQTSESSRYPSSLPTLESTTLLHQSSGVGRLNSPISNYSSARIESPIEAKETIQEDGLAHNHSEYNDNSISTSGYSSMISHPHKQEDQKDALSGTDSSFHMKSASLSLHSNDSSFLGRNTYSVQEMDTSVEDCTLDSNSSKMARRLWTETKAPHSLPQLEGNRNKPLKVSILGSAAWSEKSVLNDSSTNLSLYPSRTVYRSTSSYQKTCIHASSPYMSPHLAARQKVKVKAIHSERINIDAMSSAARKIFESIENMSIPLRDAERIPSGNNYSPLSFPLSNVSNSNISVPETSSAPQFSKLLTPSAASVARTFHSAQHIDLNDSSSVPDRPLSTGYNTTSNDKKSKGGGKITTHRGEYLHYSSKSREIIEEVVYLPSVPLPVINLPTFNFDVINDLSKPMISNISNSNTEYIFSLPITEITISFREQLSDRATSAGTDTDGFVFSQPLNTVINNNVSIRGSTFLFNDAINASASSSQSPLNFQMPSTSSKFQLKVRANAPEEKSQSTGRIPVASHLKSGSVMDILGKTSTSLYDKSITCSSGFGQKFAPPPGSWSCPICLINNKADDEKCAACQGPKPGCIQSQVKQDVEPMDHNNSFAEKFKPPPGSWSCPTCMINNKEDAKICIACETVKPGVTSGADSVNIVKTWGDQFKPPASLWQCDNYSLQNSTSESKNAGTINTSASDFKFGITTSNNGIFKMPSTPPDPLPLAKCISSTTPVFVFGEQTSTTVQAPTFKFGFGNVSNTNSSNIAVSSSSTVVSHSTETSMTTSTKAMPLFSIFNSTASQNVHSLTVNEAPAVALGYDNKNIPAIEKKTDMESTSEQEVFSSIKPPSSNEFSFAFSAPSSEVSYAGINANKTEESEQSPLGTGRFHVPKFESSCVFGKVETTSSSSRNSSGFSFGLKHSEPVTTNVPSRELPSKSGSFSFRNPIPITTQSTEAETNISQSITERSKPEGFLFDLGKKTGVKRPVNEKHENVHLLKKMKPSEPNCLLLPNKILDEATLNSTMPSSSSIFSFSIPLPPTNVSTISSSAVTTAPSLLPQLSGAAKVTETPATTNSAVSLPCVFGGKSSAAQVSSLFGRIPSNTKTTGEGTAAVTTTTITPIFNIGLNSTINSPSEAVTTNSLLFGMNVTKTTAGCLQSSSTSTASLPAFGTFQIPVSTSGSSVMTTSVFNFNAPTNLLPGFGNHLDNRISPPTTTSAPLPLFSVNTTPCFSTPDNTSNLFAFGSQNNNPSFTPIGSGDFAFGTPVSTAAAPNLSFGSLSTFGNPTQPLATVGGFASNNAATATNNQNPSPFGNSSGFNFSATPSFQFSSQSNTTGVFVFTGNQGNASQQKPSASLFSFGQQPPQTTQQQPSQPAAAQNLQFDPPTGFNFSPFSGNNSSSFPFSVHPATPYNPFDPSNCNTTRQTPRRSVQRAAKRTRR